MLKNRSVEMPSGQIIVIGVLLGLFDGVLQLLLVVLVDKLAGLLALIRHELGVSPLLRQRPDLNRLVFGENFAIAYQNTLIRSQSNFEI